MTDRRRFGSARTEDTYDYSDDFSDDDPMPIKSAPEKNSRRGRGRNQGKGRGRGRGQGRHSQARSDTQLDVVSKRLLSASKMRINELQNQVEDMKRNLKLVVDENKLFKRMQHKQEKALMKFEDREGELPQMIQSHSNEVRSLREQLRRTQEKYEKTDRYLRDAEDELERVSTKAKKYKALSDQKDLAERSDLDRRLNKAELAIEEKECRIRELERHMEIIKKNHRHELGIERARYKESQKQLEQTKDTNTKLEAILKEKEKQLDAKNIYSNRMLKPTSYNGTPAESPAPWRQNLKKKSESMSDLAAPRSKARAYEERRKAVEEKKKEKLHLPKLPNSPKKPVEKPALSPVPKQKWEDEDREKEEEPSASGPNFTFSSLKREDSDSDFWRRQEERFKQDKDNREKQEEERKKKAEEEKKEHERFQEQREKFKRDMEERERKERQRREEDVRERFRQEAREQEEKEKKEMEKKEAEQREKERKEQERRAKEERERLDNDPRLAEERRKKEELLRRLQQLDANRDGSQPSSDPFAPSDSTRRKANDHPSDPFAPSDSTRRKVDNPPPSDPFAPLDTTLRKGGDTSDPFLLSDSTRKKVADSVASDPFAPSDTRRRGGGDHSDPFAPSPSKRNGRDPFATAQDDSSHSSPSSRKDYTFKRSVENMHKGKPAYEDGPVHHQKKTKDDDIGGYQPSFTSSGKATGSGKKKPLSLFDDDEETKPAPKTDKKTKLMSDLFGSHLASTTASSQKDEGDEFFLTSKPSPPNKQQTQPRRTSGFPWDAPSSNTKTNGSAPRESSTLFGGGAALVDDDVGGGGGAKSTMLPKRTRQPSTTFGTKPAMMVVDSLDDDIEEVIL